MRVYVPSRVGSDLYVGAFPNGVTVEVRGQNGGVQAKCTTDGLVKARWSSMARVLAPLSYRIGSGSHTAGTVTPGFFDFSAYDYVCPSGTAGTSVRLVAPSGTGVAQRVGFIANLRSPSGVVVQRPYSHMWETEVPTR